jgi:peptidoglycan/LPS O-acetylase OafA/YrhL
MLRFDSSYFWSTPMTMAGYPLIAVAAASLVGIAVVFDPGVLRMSWLRGIGKVSYGLYLWHVTGIEVVARLVRPVGAWLIPLSLIVSLVPTLISWLAVEKPALSLKRFARMRPADALREPVPVGRAPIDNFSTTLAERES